MMTGQAAVTSEFVVAEADRRRRRRRGLATGALVIALVAGGLGLVSRLGGSPKDSHTIAPRAAGPDARALLTGPVPSLGRLFALPDCPSGGGLSAWAADAMRPYVSVDPSTARPAPLADVAKIVPVLRDAPPSGTCARSVALGDVSAWEVQGRDGQLVGRAAGTPLADPVVPSRLVAQPSKYLQESVASGQGFGGIIDGHRLEGVTGGAAVVVDLAPTPGTAADRTAAGLAMLARLSFASVAPLSAADAFRLPAQAPDGFTRCTENVSHLRQRSWSTEVELCDGDGRTITVTWGRSEADPVDELVDVNGAPGRVSALPGGRMAIAVDTAGGSMADPARAEASWRADAEQLAALLRSVPAVDPRLRRPRAGTGDVRALLTDGDRLRTVIENAGATGVAVTPLQPCGSIAATICPVRVEVNLLLPSGPRATLFLYPSEQRPDLGGAGPGTTGIETVAGIDVVQQSTSPRPGGPSIETSVFDCGKVKFNIGGVDVFAFVRRLIPTLGC